MRRFFCLILLAVGLVVVNQSGSKYFDIREGTIAAVPGLSESEESAPVRDRLSHDNVNDQPSPIAMLSTGQNNIRLGSPRPQRIIPANGTKQQRTCGKWSTRVRLLNKPFYCNYGRMGFLLPAPIQSAVSCHYFIIALRHIIR